MTFPFLAPLRRAFLVLSLFALTPAAIAQVPPGAPGGMPPLAMLLLDETIAGALSLTDDQQAAWNKLDALDRALETQVATSRETLRLVVVNELAKALPDIVLVETTRAYEQTAINATQQAVNNYALSLYSSFADNQKALLASAARAYNQRSGAPRANR